MRETLRNGGHHEPRVRLRQDIDHQAKTVDVSISGDAGPRVRVVDYTLTGLERTREDVAEGMIWIEKDSWYDGKAVDQSIADLYRLGVFETVQLETRDVGEDEVALDITVKEAEAREVSFLAGWGSWELLRGNVTYTDRNLFGRGQRLRGSVKGSVRGYGTNLTWTEPSLFYSRTALNVTAFFKEREEPAFTDRSFGLNTSLSRRLAEGLEGTVGYSIQSRDATAESLISNLFDNQFISSTIFSEISYDHRDSIVYPTWGHFERLRFDFATPALGGEINFARIVPHVAAWVPLLDGLTLGLRAETGLIWWFDDTRSRYRNASTTVATTRCAASGRESWGRRRSTALRSAASSAPSSTPRSASTSWAHWPARCSPTPATSGCASRTGVWTTCATAWAAASDSTCRSGRCASTPA